MMPLTTSTSGKKAGIVGLGRIGMAIAKRCEAVGLTVGYYGRTKKAGNDFAYFDAPVKLADWADILIVATPGGPSTEGLISADVLNALGPTGSFINIARGTVVDEPALIKALQERRIASAGIDVYLNEPNPDPRFAALDNVVLYPHHGNPSAPGGRLCARTVGGAFRLACATVQRTARYQGWPDDRARPSGAWLQPDGQSPRLDRGNAQLRQLNSNEEKEI